ncbi:hypothetical protein HYALB_00003984 [Hymenoscyphus albidus]|uniref:Inositol polyphosphate-related phosphatase domain-containing protein n=1 Tax=Hymenoscyphus albidus TaxID=595503 RepID=A0A9N9LSF9_9HELO|nr:hypothetical protein HYALB_00003984 [Hymenoscyphus albidus]
MATSARTSLDHDPVEVEPESTTSSPHSLSKAVLARRDEYTRKRKIKIKIGSWNVAACLGTDLDLESWFADGKGVDEQLSGITFSDDGYDRVESVAAQEARRNKTQSTALLGDNGVIPGGEEIGLYVLGLQEVIDLSSITQVATRVYADPGPTNKWRKATENALPKGYIQIVEQQQAGLLLLIYAHPDVAPSISAISTVCIPTGFLGFGFGTNKGAVVTRLLLGETTRMVFVNSHLASGSDPAHLDRRLWDVSKILQDTHFEPINWSGVLDDAREGFGNEDFGFWFGDLNFRLDGLPGKDIRRLLLLHTRGEYDPDQKSGYKIEKEIADYNAPVVVSTADSDDESDEDTSEPPKGKASNNTDASSLMSSLPDPDDFIQDASQDPTSIQATIDSLLPHDQLLRMQKEKKAFHEGWREGKICFLPTYKYDVGSMGMFDSSEKMRAPSWCDRILYRTRKDILEYEEKKRDEDLVKIRDEEMKARGIDQAGDEEDVLFNYDPEEDGGEPSPDKETPPSNTNNDYDEYNEYNEDEMNQQDVVITKEGFVDSVHLDYYTSHQRILSSDHKPVDAVFSIEYDAVIPDLKAKIQQEVARELDRQENEGRPGITIVVEQLAGQVDNSSRTASGNSTAGVDFGNVAYLQRSSCTLTIANTSQVPATFAFVDRPNADDSETLAPSWLTVRFIGSDTDESERADKDLKRDITLEPGDAINVNLEVFVENLSLCQALNEETAHLDDILVLRVTDGRDHFLPIHGNWLQSCFSRSIDQLIRVPEGGVRALMPRRDGANGGPVNRGQPVCWSAPRELFKLTEAVEVLTERVIADSNMIENAQIPMESTGWPFDDKSWLVKDDKARESARSYFLEALDSDKVLLDSFPLDITSIEKLEITAEVLMKFLSSLTDGIVPEFLWKKLEADISQTPNPLTDPEEVKSWVLDVLTSSPNHNISFVFLTSMLARVSSELAPVPKYNWSQGKARSARSSMDTVRRSLSWRSARPASPPPEDPAILRREKVEKSFVDIWHQVIFKGPEGLKDKERRVVDERRRGILAPFLKVSR